jgi:hypothetical protein
MLYHQIKKGGCHIKDRREMNSALLVTILKPIEAIDGSMKTI